LIVSDSQRLDDAIRVAFGLADDVDLTAIAYGKTDGWDSVAHMQLVAGVEDAFGIMLETDDVIAMSDYPAIRRILREHHEIALEP
jgi:acyl carrier protein